VVADNGSRDGTPEAVRSRFPSVQLIELHHNAGSAARTVAARERPEPYLAFADDDSWWEPGSLSRAVALMDAHARVALLAARVLVGEDGRLDPTCLAMEQSPLAGHPGLPGRPVLGFLACAAVVRREPFLSVGGFHPRLGVGGEEWLLAVDLAAAGWELAYQAQLVARHQPPPRPDSTARRAVMARNRLWCAWLRRRPARAFGLTLAELARARDPAVRQGLVAAAVGAPWVLRERRPLPEAVERDLLVLESIPHSS
jgi:GT2 family glycosyltransferase